MIYNIIISIIEEFSLSNNLIIVKLLKPFVYANKYTFSDPASSLMVGIIDLHHTIFFYLIVVFVLVFWLLFYLLYFNSNLTSFSYFSHCSVLEIVWTLFPSFIIGAILLPSLSLLHSSDELTDPAMTLKVIGHQWYWSYEYSDYNTSDPSNNVSFDAYIKSNWINLLADPVLVLPVRTVIRFLITSEDVLHSWAMPAWGVKMDAVPGRLNQVIISLFKPGLYYGQCSEICGIGHGFMPITIEVLPMIHYLEWLYFKNLSSLDSFKIPYSSSGFHELVHFSYFSLDLGNVYNPKNLISFNLNESLSESVILSNTIPNLNIVGEVSVLNDFEEDESLALIKNDCIYNRLSKKASAEDFIYHQLLLNTLNNSQSLSSCSEIEVLDSAKKMSIEEFIYHQLLLNTLNNSQSLSSCSEIEVLDSAKKMSIEEFIYHQLLINVLKSK